jgi:cyclohexanone monooxygenase
MTKEGSGASQAELMQLADFKKMEEIRNRVDSIVRDKSTAEILKPYFNMFCKRPCFSDAYLEAFNRPNVVLVDTQGRGVERITERAVVAAGSAYEVDCIIYATGFEVAVPTYRAGNFKVLGANGLSLEEKWSQGVRTLHGIYTRNFPNMFVLLGLRQAGAGFNNTYVISEQSRHVAAIIQRCIAARTTRVEVSEAAEEQWQEVVRTKAIPRDTFVRECTPGYYNNEGNTSNETLYQSLYGGGSVEYFNLIADWRHDGFERDMERE